MRLKVKEVGPGIFSSERFVAFEVDGKEYSLFVDERSVHEDKTLDVQLVASNGKSAMVELPSETFSAGSRLSVPKDLLLDE